MDDGRRHPINLRNENQEEPHHFKNESMDDGRRHPINLRNENQEEPHHFKNKINYTHRISIRHQEIESQKD